MKIWKNFKIILAILFSFNTMAQNHFMAVATIDKIKGDVQINKELARVGSEITEGMNINIKKPNDFVDIKYQNGHKIRILGGNVKIKELNPKSSLMVLVKGTLFSLIQALTPNEKFVVKTRRASFGVRGTRFYITESASESYLCVCEGVVKATNLNLNKDLDVEKDHDLFISKSKKFQITQASNMMVKMGNDVFGQLEVTPSNK